MGLPPTCVDARSGPCGTHSKTISAPRHDAGAKFPTQSSFSLPSHLQNLTESPSANRELTEPQQAEKQLDGLNYQSAWPSVVNWRMPQCRAAGPQCDQKVNKELGCILWKAVYHETTTAVALPTPLQQAMTGVVAKDSDVIARP